MQATAASLSRGDSVDPYYQSNLSGALVAVPCRKSYVVLISDGAWNTDDAGVRLIRSARAGICIPVI